MINMNAQKMLFLFFIFFSIYMVKATKVLASPLYDEAVFYDQPYFIAFYIPDSLQDGENTYEYNEDTDIVNDAGEAEYTSIDAKGFMARVGRNTALFLGNVRNAGILSWIIVTIIMYSMYLYASKAH